jgi:hypothetical protein
MEGLMGAKKSTTRAFLVLEIHVSRLHMPYGYRRVIVDHMVNMRPGYDVMLPWPIDAIPAVGDKVRLGEFLPCIEGLEVSSVEFCQQSTRKEVYIYINLSAQWQYDAVTMLDVWYAANLDLRLPDGASLRKALKSRGFSRKDHIPEEYRRPIPHKSTASKPSRAA